MPGYEECTETMLLAALGAMSVVILPFLYILLVIPWTHFGAGEPVKKLIRKLKEEGQKLMSR